MLHSHLCEMVEKAKTFPNESFVNLLRTVPRHEDESGNAIFNKPSLSWITIPFDPKVNCPKNIPILPFLSETFACKS